MSIKKKQELIEKLFSNCHMLFGRMEKQSERVERIKKDLAKLTIETLEMILILGERQH